MSHCVYDHKAAAFSCVQCRSKFCTDCAVHGGSEHAAVLICPACGGHLEALAVRETLGPALTFRHYFATVPTWPFAGNGIVVVFLNALFVFAMLFLAPVAYGFAAALHVVVGLIAAALFWFIAGGYLTMLLFGTLRTTALREEGPPGAPSDASPLYMIRAVVRLVALLVFWTLPAVVAAYVADGTPDTWERFSHMMLANVATLAMLTIGPGSSLVVRVLAGLAILMLPMSLLAVARLDSLRGLNPFLLVPRIVRVAEHYAYSCLAFYAVPLVIAVLCVFAFAPTMRAYWALESVSALPEFGLGSYALSFIACLVVVYGVFVAGRVLGALGAADADRLDWE